MDVKQTNSPPPKVSSLVTSLTTGSNPQIVRHRGSFDKTQFYNKLLTNRARSNGIHVYSDFTVCKHLLYFPVYFCQQVLSYSDSLSQKLLINATLVSENLNNFIFSLWPGMPCWESEMSKRFSQLRFYLAVLKLHVQLFIRLWFLEQPVQAFLIASKIFPTMKYNFISIYMPFSLEHLNTSNRSLTKFVE